MPCHFIFVEPPSIFIYQSLVIVVNKCTIDISFSVQFSPLTDTVGKDFEISIFSKAVQRPKMKVKMNLRVHVIIRK